MMIASLVLASLATLSLTQDDRERFGCGFVDQGCCSDDIIEDFLDDMAPSPSYYYYNDDKWCWDSSVVCFKDKCINQKDLPCGQVNERCCGEDEVLNDYFGECFRNLFCVEGQCLTDGQLPCGGHDEPCCEPFKYETQGYYYGRGYGYNDANECFNGLYCLEGTCKGEAALPCGQDGERCCQPGDIPSSGYDYGGYAYEDDFCFYPAMCSGGECSTCNKAGDKCCVNKQQGTETCEGPHLCKDGECVACGQVGMQCCPDGVEDYGDSNPCYDGLDCLQGSCQYCGYQNSACCGTGENASCKLNDLICNGETEKCELCGNMDEMCCGNNRCNADYLECVEGMCTCGGEGQSCCAGVCSEGLRCSHKGVCS